MIDTCAIRNRLIHLAVSGQLVEQEEKDGNACDLVCKISMKINKKNPRCDISDNEIPYQIPSNWTWCRLSDIGSTNIGLTYHPEDISAVGIPVLKSNNIKENKMVFDDIVKVSCEIKEKEYLNANDILICSRNGSKSLVGKCAIYDGRLGDTAFGAFMAVYRTVCFEYCYYFFQTKVFRRYFENENNKQINQVTQTILKNAIIPLPPFDEQTRIVKKLKEAFDLLDGIDKLQNAYNFDIEILKSKLIDASIQGKLTEQLLEDGSADELFAEIQAEKDKLIKEKKIKKEKALEVITEDEIPFEISDNWKWIRLGDICSKISSGNTPAGGSKGGAYVSEGYCFFREQNIYNDGIHNDGMVYITEELLNKRPNSTVLPKDILLNITGGSIGRCALIPDDFSRGSINQHILIIRVVDPRLRFYIHKCLCSPYYQKMIMGNVVGDKDGVSAGRCKNTLIPLPPLFEQNRIVEKIEGILSLIQ